MARDLRLRWMQLALIASKGEDPRLREVVGAMTDRAFRRRIFSFLISKGVLKQD